MGCEGPAVAACGGAEWALWARTSYVRAWGAAPHAPHARACDGKAWYHCYWTWARPCVATTKAQG